MPRRPRLRKVPEDDRQAPRQVPGLRQAGDPEDLGRGRAGVPRSGFYITDYGKDGKGPRKAESEKPAAEKPSESKSEGGAKEAKSKPEPSRPSRLRARAGGRLARSERHDPRRARAGGRRVRCRRAGVRPRAPRDAGHGDLATNLAMLLARRERVNPREMAARVVAELRFPPTVVSRTEIAGPGFINFWLAENQLADAVADDPRAGQGVRAQRRRRRPQGQPRVRLGESHRAAPRRSRPRRGAGRRDRVALRVDRARRHPRVLHQRRRRPDRPARRQPLGPRQAGGGPRRRDTRRRVPRRVPAGERAAGARRRGGRVRPASRRRRASAAAARSASGCSARSRTATSPTSACAST